jgi:hypothetical protein
VGRTVRWLITLGAAVLALGACVGVAYLILPGDTGNRLLIGTSAGVVVGAVIAVWGASSVDRTSPPEANPGESGRLAVALSAYAESKASAGEGLRYEGHREQGQLLIVPHHHYWTQSALAAR